MNICWCTIRVTDIEKSKKFYGEALGLSMERCFSPDPATEIAFFKGEDGAEVELIAEQGVSFADQTGRVSIGFSTADFEGMLQRMKDYQVEIIRGPLTFGKNTLCFFVADPDGVEIQIVDRH